MTQFLNNRRLNGLGHLHVLDDYLIFYILSTLDAQDICRCQRVSAFFYVIANQPSIWSRHTLNSLTKEHEFVYDARSWKHTYFNLFVAAEKRVALASLSFADVVSQDAHVDWFRNNVDVSQFTQLPLPSTIDRVRASDLSLNGGELFNRNYRSVARPLMVLDAMREWPSYADAQRVWTVENLVRRFPSLEFDITHVGDGECRVSLQNYAAYMRHQRDETPLVSGHISMF
jgi:hypothetical protein